MSPFSEEISSSFLRTTSVRPCQLITLQFYWYDSIDRYTAWLEIFHVTDMALSLIKTSFDFLVSFSLPIASIVSARHFPVSSASFNASVRSYTQILQLDQTQLLLIRRFSCNHSYLNLFLPLLQFLAHLPRCDFELVESLLLLGNVLLRIENEIHDKIMELYRTVKANFWHHRQPALSQLE